MLKILQARLQQYMNREFWGVQAWFRKGRGTRDQIADICWIIEKEFQKNIYFCCIDYAKARDCVDYNAAAAAAPKYCGKFWKRREYQTTWHASWEICMKVKKQQLELDLEQQTGSKLGKEYIKDIYYHPAYLTCRQSTSREVLDWMKHKLESRLLGEISIISDRYHPYGRKWRRTKELLDENESGEWKSWLKAQHSEN